ncbi:MAG: hypothetical protein EPO36_12420 [Chloroflexota bacterium]|nr:MAG: hypothetical protein EPO36_12420 [Chloroflexota bacterium]
MAQESGVVVAREGGTRKKEPTRMEQLFNVLVFVLFLILWGLFAYALVTSQGSLDSVWAWSRSQHIIVQGVIWLLVLPLAVGLWIWESGWPLIVRLVLVVSIGAFNLYLFFPKDLLKR